MIEGGTYILLFVLLDQNINIQPAVGSSKWNTWAGVAPSPRYHHQSCVTDGRVIMFGGLGVKEKTGKPKALNDLRIYSGAFKTSLKKIFVFSNFTLLQ